MKGIANNRKDHHERSKLSIDLAVMLAFFIIFFFRCIAVMNSYNERGGYAYVELLNYSMPIVKESVYDKTDYAENDLSIKNILMEAAGIDKLNSISIVAGELNIFSEADDMIYRGSKPVREIVSNTNSHINPYEIDDGSISKVTEEEINSGESDAYNEALKKTLNIASPEVLIYHTHAHEAFSEVGAAANFRSDNEELTVAAVGDVLASELENGYGIATIHDKTLHDTEYTGCYLRSKETVQSYLDRYGDFKLIIDLHRDSSENKNLIVANLNNQSLAKFMFVLGESSPRLEQNQIVVNNMLSISRRLFPSLVREEYQGIFLYNTSYGTFNLGLSDNMIIIEDGSAGNTVEEAKNTAKYIARIIAEYINNSN